MCLWSERRTNNLQITLFYFRQAFEKELLKDALLATFEHNTVVSPKKPPISHGSVLYTILKMYFFISGAD